MHENDSFRLNNTQNVVFYATVLWDSIHGRTPSVINAVTSFIVISSVQFGSIQ